MPDNFLYYGDNLDILRRWIGDESVDLVYLDPPFNSNATYNILFREKSGTASAAQIKAFGDTWQWDQGAAQAYAEVVEAGGRVSQVMQAFRTFLGTNDMLAYLAMMAPRLVELRRVLKPTGSIYLHCDPTASHYLKLLMDAVFGPRNFRNEIVWHYGGPSPVKTSFARKHDTILMARKSEFAVFNPQWGKLPFYLSGRARKDPDGRLWVDQNLGKLNPETIERMRLEGRIFTTATGESRRKQYLDEMEGDQLDDVWDIPIINSQARERLGYPTQKPEALLERIINASSNEGDVVLDPFCGCGTTIAAAQKLNRRWIGIDITHLAITLIKHRLQSAFGEGIASTYTVIGEPVCLTDAQALAATDPYQFQYWALGLVGARPAEVKKGADKGIDGGIYFHDEGEGGPTKQVVISVKAGHTNVAHLRDLRGVLEREKGQIGLLICMEEPTHHMRAEAAGAGFYESPWGGKHPRLQILTIEQLLAGKRIDCPPLRQTNVTFKKAPRVNRKAGAGVPAQHRLEE